MKTKYFYIGICYLLFTCSPTPKTAEMPTLAFTEIENPAISGSQTPNLFSSNNELFLSWTEKDTSNNSKLIYSALKNNVWSAPTTIASGNNWFVNWADFPALAVAENGWKAAHFLAKSDKGTYDYNINISTTDSLGNWQAPFIPHTDTLPAEYGFVSMVPQGNEITAVWLDGRFTKMKDKVPNGGAMTLRTGTFNDQGQFSEETLLDDRVCDCCQTDLVSSKAGKFVVYRNRTEEEIRDIYFMRKSNGEWSAPKAVADDQWQISGCPVNGPAIGAIEDNLAVAWFTATNEQPSVKVAFYDNTNDSFGEPFIISQGNMEQGAAPAGRVDIIMKNNKTAWVSWVETKEENAAIMLAEVHKTKGIIWQKSLTETSAERASGFPVMEKFGNNAWFVWTDTQLKKVRSAYVPLNDQSI